MRVNIGLVLEGATWSTDKLVLNNGESVRLGASQIRWVQVEEREGEGAATGAANLPVYLNDDRSDVLFTVDLPFEGGSAAMVAMRAVCLTAGG
jgi:dynein heavy chain 1, cytosolic